MITSLSYLQAVRQRKQSIISLVNDTEAVEIYRFFFMSFCRMSAVVCCYLLLSCICALFLCLLSVIWGVAFYCVAVNVLCCLCEDFCFLVLLCLVLCLVILLYYSNCIIVFLTIWYLLYIIIYNTIQYRKN